ncbi:MAG: 2Fe-2S iron-sulfur cluster-binding protein, partial [Cyanobacteria bacterium J06554_1]
MVCKISFPDSEYAPLTLDAHTPLADTFTVQNSPILFGCRTGICGTCLVTVIGDV